MPRDPGRRTDARAHRVAPDPTLSPPRLGLRPRPARSRSPHAHVVRRRVTFGRFDERQLQRRPTLQVQSVAAVARTPLAGSRIRRARMHAIGEGIVEIELRREITRRIARIRAYLEMDVHGATGVRTRVDRCEARAAL